MNGCLGPCGTGDWLWRNKREFLGCLNCCMPWLRIMWLHYLPYWDSLNCTLKNGWILLYVNHTSMKLEKIFKCAKRYKQWKVIFPPTSVPSLCAFPSLLTFCSGSVDLHNGHLSSLKVRLRILEFRCQILITCHKNDPNTIMLRRVQFVSWCPLLNACYGLATLQAFLLHFHQNPLKWVSVALFDKRGNWSLEILGNKVTSSKCTRLPR